MVTTTMTTTSCRGGGGLLARGRSTTTSRPLLNLVAVLVVLGATSQHPLASGQQQRDEVVVDVGSHAVKVARLNGLSQKVEESVRVTGEDSIGVANVVAFDVKTGNVLVGKAATRQRSYSKFNFITKYLHSKHPTVLDAIRNINFEVKNKIILPLKNQIASFHVNKNLLKIEELVSHIFIHIKSALPLKFNDKLLIIADTHDKDLINKYNSICKIAGIHHHSFIDIRLPMAQIALNYSPPGEQSKNFLVIDYSFGSIKILAAQNLGNVSGKRQIDVLSYQEYDVGTSIFVSQIYDYILNEIKEKLPKLKLTSAIFDKIKDVSFETYKIFAYSQLRKLGPKIFGTEMRLERSKILSLDQLKNVFSSFSDRYTNVLGTEDKLDVVLIGSACFDQTYKKIVAQTFPHASIYNANNPSKALVNAATLILKNKNYISKPQIKLSNSTINFELEFSNNGTVSRKVLKYEDVYPFHAETLINASNLTLIKAIVDNETLFECKINYNNNVSQVFKIKLNFDTNLKLSLNEISIPNTLDRSSRLISHSCNYIHNYSLSEEDFKSIDDNIKKVQNVKIEQKKLKESFETFTQKIFNSHNLIEELKTSSNIIKKGDNFEAKLEELSGIVQKYSDILEFQTHNTPEEVKKVVDQFDKEVQPLTSNSTFYQKFPNALTNLNATLHAAQTLILKAQNHTNQTALLDPTQKLIDTINGTEEKILKYSEMMLQSGFFESKGAALTDIGDLNFLIYYGQRTLENVYETSEKTRILNEIEMKYKVNKTVPKNSPNATDDNSLAKDNVTRGVDTNNDDL